MEEEYNKKLINLIFTGVVLLLGEEDVDFRYYRGDYDWWVTKLWTKRN